MSWMFMAFIPLSCFSVGGFYCLLRNDISGRFVSPALSSRLTRSRSGDRDA
ncbi:hypothetical protein JCM18909_1201 [Cutibacterium acnes JCM 18909]|nr:hypothetical protein JCM18909_1201 [Cutibacterium acnes JCM 18909]